jgi:hypothetical protein
VVQRRIGQVLFHIGMAGEYPFNQPVEQPVVTQLEIIQSKFSHPF